MHHRLRIEEFSLEPEVNRLSGPSGTASLEPQVVRLLVHLAERKGELVSRDELIREVWDGSFVSDDAITYAVGELRKALGDDARRPRFIETIPKKGYRLVAKVTPVEEGGREARSVNRWMLLGVLPLVLLAAVVGFYLGRHPAKTFLKAREFEIGLTPEPSSDDAYVPFAMVDDHRIVYADEDYTLHIRELETGETVQLGTGEQGWEPFVSPDGLWVGFWIEGVLKKVSTNGGAPVFLAKSFDLMGGSWGGDGTIVFSPGEGVGLRTISSDGGEARSLTTLDRDAGEREHCWPQILPGGRAVLYTVRTADKGDRLAVVRLDNHQSKTLVEGASRARYVRGGYLAYERDRTLFGVRFDLERLELRGPSVALVKNVRVAEGAAQFDVAPDGSLIYVSGDPLALTLAWVDREGRRTPLPLSPRPLSSPRLDPTGERVAIDVSDGAHDDLWVYDPKQGGLTRITSDGVGSPGAWTPDGHSLTYSGGILDADSGPLGAKKLFVQPLAARGAARLLLAGAENVWPEQWLRDGSALLFSRRRDGSDIALLHPGGEPEVTPVISRPPYYHYGFKVSPNGRWGVFVGDDTGVFQIYLASFPDLDTVRQITTEGGTEPVWSPRGDEIFYCTRNHLMTIRIDPRTGSVLSAPHVLFDWHDPAAIAGIPNYDVAPDGRFLMVEGSGEHRLVMHFVENGSAKLRQMTSSTR